MISRETTNRMKAAAIAAVMCISAAAAAVPCSIAEMASLTVSAADTLAADGTYKDFTKNVAKSGMKTITFTLTANYTGNFSYGFGISTAAAPYWYEWDGKGWVDTKGGTVSVPGISVPVTEGKEFTITIDTSSLDLKYADEYDAQYDGTFEFRNYYSGEGTDGKITIKSVTANGQTTTTPEPTTPDPTTPDPTDESTEKPDPGVSGAVLEEGGTPYTGKTADLAASGIKNITVVLDTGDYSGKVTYGFGISIADTPYWMEWNGKGWTDAKDGTIEVPGTEVTPVNGEIVVVIDTSSLELKYKDATNSEWDGHFELRNYYSDGNPITVKSVTANGTQEPTPITPPENQDPDDEHKLANKDGQTANNKNGTWSFTDNTDGTGTMTATQARQIEFETPLTLTQGFDEEYYAAEGITPVEGKDPLNGHKFSYSDFGVSGIGSKGNIVIESLMATIQSEQSVKTFMYGGGLNVEKSSPADTESAKALKGMATTEDAGYWYNDMGEDNIEKFEEAGVEFGITPGYGYFLSAEDNQLGKYFNVFWDVPKDVQPWETSGEISFQYWYGVEDTEEYTEIPAVDLVGGVLTYTETQSFDYTDRKKVDVDRAIKSGDMSGEISFTEDLGLTANDDVHAVVFTVSADQDLDKLVYGIGASVGEEWQQWAAEGAKWNFVVTNTTSGDVEIAWIVPAGIDLNEEYGNLQFGYWYGGKGETELDSVTLKSVEVFYNEKEEETDSEPEPEVVLWGDADDNGKVNILDVILLNRTIMGRDEMTAQGEKNADVDVSGTPDSTDALNILKLIVGLLTQADFPIK